MNKFYKYLGSIFMVIAISNLGLGSVPVAQAATITMAEVATHNTTADCWVVVNNNVYNLTSFIATHPGGSSAITAVCGKDGTAAFNSGPHTSTSLNAISSLIVGTLASVVTPVLTSVELTPSTPTVSAGGTVQITATPKDQNGVDFIGATITFDSGNIALVTVNNSGVATGISPGSSTISVTATSGSVIVGSSINITVTGTAVTPVLTSVLVSPDSSTISSVGSVQLTATPKDQNGVNFVGATTTFSSSNPAIATVDTNTGLVSGASVGSTTITATSVSGSVTVTGTSLLTITSLSATPVLTSVSITPSTNDVLMGSTLQLTATPLDQNNVNFVGATTTFNSSNAAIATVDSNTGLLSGVSVGSATITVTSTSGNVVVSSTKDIMVTTTTTVSPPVNGGGDGNKDHNRGNGDNHENGSHFQHNQRNDDNHTTDQGSNRNGGRNLDGGDHHGNNSGRSDSNHQGRDN